jgi:hypothetical protein
MAKSHVAPSREGPEEDFDGASVDEMCCESVEVDDEYLADSDSDGEGSESARPATSKHQKRDYSLRYFMLTMLCIVTFFGSFGMWAFGRSIENNEFNTGFQALAHKLVDQVEHVYANDVTALGSAADRFTSIGREDGLMTSLAILFSQNATQGAKSSSWPFVTAPRFGNLVAPYLHLTESTSIYLAPLIYDRLTWEAYSSWEELRDNEMPIFDDQGRSPDATVYAPIRQYYPNVGTRTLVNYNLLSRDGFAGDLGPALLGSTTLLSKTWTYDDVNQNNTTTSYDVLKQIHNSSADPLVYMSVPV